MSFNKEAIQRQAFARMTKIEELYCDHVPIEANAYWRLNFLIAEGLRAYIGSYGLLPIHPGDANDGRLDLGLDSLSQFERDTVQFLKEYIDQEEIKFQQRRPALVSRSL